MLTYIYICRFVKKKKREKKRKEQIDKVPSCSMFATASDTMHMALEERMGFRFIAETALCAIHSCPTNLLYVIVLELSWFKDIWMAVSPSYSRLS